MADPNQNINQGKKNLKEVSDIVGALDEGFQSLADRITGVVDAMSEASSEARNFDRISRDINSTLNAISRQNEKSIRNQIELNSGQLASKKVIEQIRNIEATREVLNQRLNSLRKTEYKDINAKIAQNVEIKKLEEEIVELTGEVEGNYKKQLNRAKEIEQKLGNTGALLKGISKIPVLGNFLNAEEALTAAQEEAAIEGTNRTKVMQAAFKSLGTTLKENVSDPLTKITLALKFFQTATKYALEFNDTQIKLQRALLISSESAKSLANNMQDFAQASNNAYVNYVKLAEANIELNNALGTNVQLTAKQLEDSIELKEAAGLEVDEREAIYKLSLLTGKTQENIFNSIGKQNKGVLSNKKVLSEVLKVSGQLAAQYKNNPELLGKAVVQAQKLGMTLEQTKNISKQLLNFEDSIAAELEAELLTGIDLNLEKARYLALQGDSAGAAQELMKNLGPNGLLKFQKMNVIQQESIARALGMGVDELADSLVKEKQLAALDSQQRKLIAEAKQKLIDQGKIEEAQAFEKNILASKNVDLALMERSEREKTAESIENLKKSFFSLTNGPIVSIIKSFNSVLEGLNNSKIAKMLIGIAGGGAALFALYHGLKGSIKLLSGIFGKGAIPVTVVNSSGGGIDGDDIGGGNIGGGNTGGRNKGKPSSGGYFKNLFGKGSGKVARGRALKGLGKKIPYAGAALMALDYLQEKGAGKDTSEAALGTLDQNKLALSGAGIGAGIGAFFGGIGAIPGAGIGYGIGSIADMFAPRAFTKETPMDTGNIVNKGETPFATGGIVSKPTRALIGEAGTEAVIPLDKFYAKLDELINVAKTGGNVYIDSTKAGTAFGIGTYKTQ